MALRCTMILDDCLDAMPALPRRSMDMVFADLPYAVSKTQYTKNPWDEAVDFVRISREARALSTRNAAHVYTCGDRLAALLVASESAYFRYSIIWEKPRASLYFHANKRPLHAHEIIQVFGVPPLTYNPQMTQGAPYLRNQTRSHLSTTQHATVRIPTYSAGERFPRSVIKFPYEDKPGKPNLHPTQKPLALMSWIVRTYTNPGDHVLDPVSGSGTTAVAALLCGRSVTCIEKDSTYFAASVERTKKVILDERLDANLEVRQ